MASKKIKLGDYCEFVKGCTGIKKAIPGQYPLVVTAEERSTHNEYQIDDTAVIIPLVSSTGHGHASIKRLHYQEGKFALGTILCALIVKDVRVINPRFLYIYLSYFKDQLLVPLMKGAANVTLSIKKIKKVEILLPSLERQLEIIELEQNHNLIDELNLEFEIQEELLSKLKQSILQEAIQGKLTADWRKQNPNTEPASELLKRIKSEKAQLIKDKKIRKEKVLPPIAEEEIPFELPDGWVWCRLGDIFTTTSGGTPKKGTHRYWKGEITWYKSGELNDSYLNIESKEKITQIGLSESSATLFPTGTLLIAMYGATAGKLAILGREATTNQAVCGFYKNGKVLTHYLFDFLLSNRSKMIKESWGMSQPNISQTYLRNFCFALPPFKEQEAIVEKVETLMQKYEALEEEIQTSEANAQILMQAVLKEAFEE